MNFSKFFCTTVAAAALAACGDTAGDTDTEEASATATEAGDDTSGEDMAATGGDHFYCFMNVVIGDTKTHYVTDAAPVPSGADEESLKADFVTALEAEYADSIGSTRTPICTILGSREEIESGSAYITGKAEERGLTTVRVDFP